MKAYKDTKIVIIGLGFLMEYIRPCYEKMLGENVKTNIIGVTADEGDIERKRKALGYKIVLNDNLGALNELKPDIILFAPPPKFALPLTKEVLLPYYNSLRAAGEELPDLYAFPPNPAGKFYLDTLGGDINVVNILPNMVAKIGDRDVSQECYSNITFPNEKKWEQENIQRLIDFLSPLGYVVEVAPEYVITMLAGCVACHNICEVIFTIFDGLKKSGINVDYRDMASAMRAYHDKKRGLNRENTLECSENAVDEKLFGILRMVTFHWFEGIKEYLMEIGMSQKLCDDILVPQLDLHLQAHQLETRQTLEYNTKCHATKGGVLEMGCKTFAAQVEEGLMSAFANYNTFDFGDDFADFIQQSAYVITKAVSDHGYTLGNPKCPYKVEHHATLFGILAKNAKLVSGDKGISAIEKGVATYGLERGGRMAQRAARDGAERTMQNYLAYGEWRAEDGQMEVEVEAYSPVHKTKVKKCAWCDAWTAHDLSEFGNLYCNNVDFNLVKGFNEKYDLKIHSFLSKGESCCNFEWDGFDMNEENKKDFEETKERLGLTHVRSFKFHTAHLYFTLVKVLKAELGEVAGEEIARISLEEFEKIFGKELKEGFMELWATDFTKAD